MYIRHMKLVCTEDRSLVRNTAFLDLGPLRIIGSKESLFYQMNRYKWPTGLSDSDRLFRAFQSIQEYRGEAAESPCLKCSQKVICLVSSHLDGNHQWPKEICPYLKSPLPVFPVNRMNGQKIKTHKLRFVTEHKCDLCAFKACCYHYPMISRMLCANFTQKEILFDIAEKRIQGVWGSVERFIAALKICWSEILWKPPEGKRKRRFRVAFVHPNHDIELIQDYYPYRLRQTAIPAYQLSVQVPEKLNGEYGKDDMLNSWILWKLMQEHLITSKKWKRTGLGSLWISGHHNFLLCMFGDYAGHPVLVTATSRWEYNTTFSDFERIGWNLNWSANQVKSGLEI